jgi:putative Ca2+/H+ antiporter (TMEM165/GDT1 family)
VLVGALGALWVMTALSAVMGWAAPALVRRSCAAAPAMT